MALTVFVALLTLLLPLVSMAANQKPWGHGRLMVSPNHRFLQHLDGTPFFWLGDTGWRLFQRLTREEAVKYLENRRQKGFNVIQVMIANNEGERNAYGQEAFENGDPGTPRVTPGNNPAHREEYDYWDHIDFVLGTAEEKGIYLAMLPAWCSLAKATLNESNAGDYIAFLARRYKDRPNVIWVNGGDCRGTDFPNLWRIMGATLKQLDPNHLVTYHPFGGTSSSMWFHTEAWLDFNMFQSGHRRYDQVREGQRDFWKGEDGWRFVAEDLAKAPPKPTLDGEPSYESIPQGLHDPTQPYWDANHVRRYAYWSVFAGACGHTYGHNAVMQMHKPNVGKGAYGVREYWDQALDAPGAGQMQWLKHLILSRPYFQRAPDQSLIAGSNGERYERVIATRGESYAFFYTFTGRPFQVQLGKISGEQVIAWWFDPRTGNAKRIGKFPNRGARSFTPPGTPANGNDWVLVLDDESKSYRPPGA
jgi:hypothetical protein